MGTPTSPFLFSLPERGSRDWQSSPERLLMSARQSLAGSVTKCSTGTWGKRKAKLTVIFCRTSQSLDVLEGIVDLKAWV